MPLLSSPLVDADLVECDVADMHKLLGVIVDSGLVFSSRLNAIIGCGHHAFSELFVALVTGGLGVQIISG